jgi:hypothetical protein
MGNGEIMGKLVFNVYVFICCCFNLLPKTCMAFLLNEAVSFLNYSV